MSSTLEIILTVADFVVALILILSILFQSSESEGLSGVLSGSAETLFGKDKTRSLDSKLSKITTIAAIVFIIITFILCVGSPKSSGSAVSSGDSADLDTASQTDISETSDTASPVEIPAE